jgi:hypothetical protein
MRQLVKRLELASRAWGIWTLALISACVGAGDQSIPSASHVERFTQVGEGVVREIPARLEWATRDNGSELNWHAAEEYCGGLVLAGRTDWRLPMIEELAALYDTEATSGCGGATCHIAAPIELTSPYQWSGSSRNQTRRVYFDFQHGSRLAPRLRPNLTRRIVCVRSVPGERGRRQ